MSLQVIRSQQGISEYVPFVLEHYVSNAAALMRIKANVTQEELAKALDVTQAYISKIEGQKNVTAKTLDKINNALKKLSKVSGK